MKKIFLLLLLFCMFYMVIAGCGGNTDETENENTSNTTNGNSNGSGVASIYQGVYQDANNKPVTITANSIKYAVASSGGVTVFSTLSDISTSGGGNFSYGGKAGTWVYIYSLNNKIGVVVRSGIDPNWITKIFIGKELVKSLSLNNEYHISDILYSDIDETAPSISADKTDNGTTTTTNGNGNGNGSEVASIYQGVYQGANNSSVNVKANSIDYTIPSASGVNTGTFPNVSTSGGGNFSFQGNSGTWAYVYSGNNKIGYVYYSISASSVVIYLGQAAKSGGLTQILASEGFSSSDIAETVPFFSGQKLENSNGNGGNGNGNSSGVASIYQGSYQATDNDTKENFSLTVTANAITSTGSVGTLTNVSTSGGGNISVGGQSGAWVYIYSGSNKVGIFYYFSASGMTHGGIAFGKTVVSNLASGWQMTGVSTNDISEMVPNVIGTKIGN